MREPSGLLPVQDKTAGPATAAAEALVEAFAHVDEIVACFEENRERSGEPLSAIWSKQQDCMSRVSDAPDGGWLIAIGFPQPSEFPTCIGTSIEAALRHVGEHYPHTAGGIPSRWSRADLAHAYADTYAAEAVCTALYRICRTDPVLSGPLGRASSSLSAMHAQLCTADYDDQVAQFQLDLLKLQSEAAVRQTELLEWQKRSAEEQGEISKNMAKESKRMTWMTIVILVCTALTLIGSVPSAIVNALDLCETVASLAIALLNFPL